MTLVQLLLAFGAAGLAWLLGSDRLLRRRIRRVIRTRVSCAACGYVLAGLPVSESLVVKCPECECELVADVSLGEVVQDIGNSDQERLGERGLRLLIALERFHCEHGDYPEGLEELVPRGIDALPLDPFSGKPFCYRRVPGKGGRPGSFLAYSVGADGADNGGVGAQNPFDAIHAGTSGIDFVIGPCGTDYSR